MHYLRRTPPALPAPSFPSHPAYLPAQSRVAHLPLQFLVFRPAFLLATWAGNSKRRDRPNALDIRRSATVWRPASQIRRRVTENHAVRRKLLAPRIQPYMARRSAGKAKKRKDSMDHSHNYIPITERF